MLCRLSVCGHVWFFYVWSAISGFTLVLQVDDVSLSRTLSRDLPLVVPTRTRGLQRPSDLLRPRETPGQTDREIQRSLTPPNPNRPYPEICGLSSGLLGGPKSLDY